MTLPEIREKLEIASRMPNGGDRGICVLRPCSVSNLIELDAKLVLAAFDQIVRAITCVESKVTDPQDHAAEIVLLQIFQEHAENFPGW